MKIVENYEGGYSLNDSETDELSFEFFYPRNNRVKYLQVGISDVRASDGIRIHYDFDRDGYAIEQPFYIEKDMGSYVDASEPIWEETAFVQSWALEDKNKTISPP